MRPFSLYLHIPFCYHKCPYCDFNTYAVAQVPEREYVQALLAELDFRSALPEWLNRPVQTIYFGGGTPSVLSAEAVKRIVAGIGAAFPVDSIAEISLEANPGGVTSELLSGYRAAGVNRLSFGVQSLQPATLTALGRIHTPEQVHLSLESAREAGFGNVSLDLMFGAPGQDGVAWERDLHDALALAPQHLSAYGLTIEKGTPFYNSWKRNVLRLPEEEMVVAMLTTLIATLTDGGFTHYEISNFARPGFEARHNLAYWNGDDYLGLGAGAHSFCRSEPHRWGRRWSNYALPARYNRAAGDHGAAESWQDVLGEREAMFEFFFLGLRKTAGVSRQSFTTRFDRTLDHLYGRNVEFLVENGLIITEGDLIRLSPEGLLLADSVISNFAEQDGLVDSPARAANS